MRTGGHPWCGTQSSAALLRGMLAATMRPAARVARFRSGHLLGSAAGCSLLSSSAAFSDGGRRFRGAVRPRHSRACQRRRRARTLRKGRSCFVPLNPVALAWQGVTPSSAGSPAVLRIRWPSACGGGAARFASAVPRSDAAPSTRRASATLWCSSIRAGYSVHTESSPYPPTCAWWPTWASRVWEHDRGLCSRTCRMFARR